jgi:tripartite-type tricarboxylate transporter receptor subunit TctC
MLTRRRVLLTSAAVAAASRSVHAEALHKTARLIVGFPAGGGTDVIARIVAEKLRDVYAPAVIVDNRPGAAARIAVDFVKRADPDGSVMLFTPDFPLTVYPHSYPKLAYDPVADFVPVSPCARSMLTVSTGPAVPDSVKTVPDFIAWAKAHPDKAQYATTSPGATPHFVGVMLAREAKVELTPVHYQGGAPALQDLLGGHIPLSVNPISETLPFAKGAGIRILAVTGKQRSKYLPDVPTLTEQGYNVVVQSWIGMFAPAKTPTATVDAANQAVKAAVAAPDYVASLAKFGNEPAYQTPDEFAATVKADIATWGPVVKESGFVAQD